MTKHEFKEWAISIGIVLGTVKALVLVCLFYSYFPRVFGISLLSLIVLGVLICMVMAVKDIRESGGW
jgi:small neutral amino acid transporter SnatA (MarC family)